MADADVLVSLLADIPGWEASLDKAKTLAKSFASDVNSMFRGNTGITNMAREVDTLVRSLESLETVQARINRVAGTQLLGGNVSGLMSDRDLARTEQMYAGMFDGIAAKQQAADDKMSASNQRRAAAAIKANDQEIQSMGEMVAASLRGQTAIQDATLRTAQVRREAAAAAMDDIIARERMMSSSAALFAGQVNRGEVSRSNVGGILAAGFGPDSARYANDVERAIKPMPTIYDRMVGSMGKHLMQWTAWGIAIGGTLAALEAVETSLHEISEFQVQGVLFQANQRSAALQGIGTDGMTQNDLLSDSIALATKWGDKVNDVAQDLSLWYKRTGDQNAAMYMTNQALEFQLTTGTQLEDVYKTLTGLSVQALGQKIGGQFGNQTFDLSHTKDILNEIYAAAVAAGGGMRQISQDEQEMGGTSSNAGELLLSSLDRDNAALKALGSTMTDSIALNAALIQSFGNAGSSASEAGEKISRIAGSLDALSKPGALKVFADPSLKFNVQELDKTLDTHHNVLMDLIKQYGSMDQAQRAFVAHTLGGTRQFEAVQATYEAWKNVMPEIKKAMEDLNQEDETAAQMHDTLANQVQRTNAEFEGLAIAVGQGALPAIQGLIGFVASSAIPAMANFAMQVSLVFNEMQRGFNSPFMQGLGKVLGSNSPASPIIGGAALGAFPLVGAPLMSMRAAYQEIMANPGGGDLGTLYTKYINSGPVWARENGKEQEFSSKAAYYMQGHPNKVPLDFGQIVQAVGYDNIKNLLALQNAGSAFNAGTGYSLNQQALAALQKKIQDEVQGPFGGGVGTGKGKGIATPEQQAAAALRDREAAYNSLIAIQESSIGHDDEEVRILQRQMDTYGATATTLRQLMSVVEDRDKHLELERSLASSQISFLQKEEAEYRKQAAAVGSNTTAHDKFLGLADQAQNKINALAAQQRNYTKAIDDGTDAVNRYYQAIADKQYSALTRSGDQSVKNALAGNSLGGAESVMANALSQQGNFAMAHFSGDNLVQKLQELADKGSGYISELQNRWDTFTQDLEKSTTDAASRGLEDIFKVLKDSNKANQADLDYWRTLIGLQKNANDLQIQYKKYMDEAGGDPYLQQLVNTWYGVSEAALNADEAAAQYEDTLQKIKDSPIVQAFNSAFSGFGSSIGQDFTNQMFGVNAVDQQIDAQNVLIQQIQDEKAAYDAMYSAVRNHTAMQIANDKLENLMLDEQIQKVKDQQKAEEDALKHVPALRKFEEDFTKNIIDDMVKNLQSQMENGVLSALTGQKGQVTPEVTALRQQAAMIQSTFKPSVDDFNKIIAGTFSPAIKDDFAKNAADFTTTIKQPLTNIIGKFDSSTTQFQKDVDGPLTTAFRNFHDDVTRLLAGGGGGGKGIPTFHGSEVTVNSGFLSNPSAIDNSILDQVISAADANNSMVALPDGSGSAIFVLPSNQTGTSPTLSGGGALSGVAAAGAAAGGLGGILGVFSGGGGGSSSGGGGGILGGIGQLLLSLGGGGAGIMGDVTGALGVAGSIGSSKSPGDSIVGSLAGAAGALGLAGIAAGGGFMSLFSGAGLAAMMNPAGIGILLGGALLGSLAGGLFGPNINPGTNPDMFSNQTGFGQEIANIQGYAGANGQNYTEDPTIGQSLGGLTELQYIDSFVSSHPGGAGLSGPGLQLWQQANQLTQGGQAISMHGLNQGNMGLSNSMDPNSPTYDNQNWASLAQQIDQMTQNVQQFNDALSSATQTALIVFNQFGSPTGFNPYVYGLPGADLTNTVGAPYTPPTAPGGAPYYPGMPYPGSRPTPGHPYPGYPGYQYPTVPSATGQSVTVQNFVPVNLDGRQISRAVQGYTLRANAAGNRYIT